MTAMRILVADDNELVRRGIARLLSTEANWEVCAEASDGSETLQKARELHPDLVLLDVSMPGRNGLETARLLRQELGPIKILIMSQNDPSRLLPSVLEAGALACIDKARLPTDLLRAIQSLETSKISDVAESA